MSGVTFTEMLAVCLAEANRIDTVQTDLVDTGLRTAPDPGQVRRREVFVGIVHMIDLVRADKIILDRLKQKTAAAAKAPAEGAIQKEERGSEVSISVAGSGDP